MALKKEWDELGKGDWCFLNDDTYIAVQFGDDKFRESVTLPIKPMEHQAFWIWDGNKETPTLSPSILVWGDGRDKPATWHGFLRKGELVDA